MPDPEIQSATELSKVPTLEAPGRVNRVAAAVKNLGGRFGGASTQEAAGTPVLSAVEDLIGPIHKDRAERAGAIDEIDMANTAKRGAEQADLLEFAKRYGYSAEQMNNPEFRIRLQVAFDAETRYLQEISRGSELADQVSMHDVVEPELRAQWERHVSALRDFAGQEAEESTAAVPDPEEATDVSRERELVGSGV